MSPLLFIDEYVSARTIFPPRASKDDPDYCLATFDNLVKRIVTMGASAGCYVIVSIAEASVESGGLPAMLRSAMSTKVLFRPTLPEARLMWDAEKVRDMPARTYGPGDAWFSSTDGIHDRVSLRPLPGDELPVYGGNGPSPESVLLVTTNAPPPSAARRGAIFVPSSRFRSFMPWAGLVMAHGTR